MIALYTPKHKKRPLFFWAISKKIKNRSYYKLRFFYFFEKLYFSLFPGFSQSPFFKHSSILACISTP